MSVATEFPIPLNEYKVVTLDPGQSKLTDQQREQLAANIQLCRDAIIFFTAIADAKGLGGHTGGPYDTVPETLIGRVERPTCCRFSSTKPAIVWQLST